MDKREFLKSFTSNNNDKHFNALNVDKTLLTNQEMTTINLLSRSQAFHLLRRIGFGPTLAEVKSISDQPVLDAVNQLLGTGNETPPVDPNTDWVNKPEENPLASIPDIKNEIEGKLRSRFIQFVDWWQQRMRDDTNPAIEKLVLLWHSVWCVQFNYDTEAMIPPPLLYRNNKTLRKYRLSDYKTLAENITLDGAMLLFQSLYYSSKNKPNENYMRELMELFTMGIGNYSEADIREGSRVLTGWRTAAYFGEPHPYGYFETYFQPDAHDIGAKTFMKDTIAARTDADNTKDQVLEQELRGLLNIMFNKKGTEISQFIANKVFRFFLYSNPAYDDQTFIDSLALEFKTKNFSIKDLLIKLFTSDNFFDQKYIGVQIKTPPEYIIGFEKILNVKYTSRRTAINAIEQELYNPPNVGSWKAYRTWVNTKTFPLRIKYANEILDLAKNKEIFDLAYAIPNYQDMVKFVFGLEELFFPVELPTETKAMNLATLKTLSKLDESTWKAGIDAKTDDVYNAIKELIKEFIKFPDFQLS